MNAKEYLESKGVFGLDTKKRYNEVIGWMEGYAQEVVKNCSIPVVSVSPPYDKANDGIKCEDGKYVWCFDEKTSRLTCKRYGEEWRDETGDGAILALLQLAEAMQEKIIRAQNCLVCVASPSADAFEICNTTYEILT